MGPGGAACVGRSEAAIGELVVDHDGDDCVDALADHVGGEFAAAPPPRRFCDAQRLVEGGVAAPEQREVRRGRRRAAEDGRMGYIVGAGLGVAAVIVGFIVFIGAASSAC